MMMSAIHSQASEASTVLPYLMSCGRKFLDRDFQPFPSRPLIRTAEDLKRGISCTMLYCPNDIGQAVQTAKLAQELASIVSAGRAQ
jgi:hypothetical protein